MTTAVTIRVDNDLKADAEDLFNDLGLNMTTAITCFLKKCVDSGAIPFTLARRKKDRHAELLATLREAEEVANDPNAPTCTDLGKLDEFLLS